MLAWYQVKRRFQKAPKVIFSTGKFRVEGTLKIKRNLLILTDLVLKPTLFDQPLDLSPDELPSQLIIEFSPANLSITKIDDLISLADFHSNWQLTVHNIYQEIEDETFITDHSSSDPDWDRKTDEFIKLATANMAAVTV